MKNKTGARFSIIGYILFFVPLSVLVGFSAVIFNILQTKGYSVGYIALFLLLYIAFATLLFSLIDIIRRKIMVDAPVEQILKATQKITEGDFSVKLLSLAPYDKYNEYDLIMQNINKMTTELSKSEMLKSEFISNVSHEIKTPLAVIQNYAKALKTGNLDKQTEQKYLNVLVSASQKLSNLVTNILKLNKLENQAVKQAKEQINIGELLRENILAYEELIESKNINLNCDISDVNAKIEPSYLELVFNNLISNAIKFTNSGGSINVALKNDGEYAVFSVADTGCGMSEETGKKIFEKFYQGDTSHSAEGNGLGLALLKKVIDIIGGEISVESQLGKGSTFTVKIKRS